MEKMQIEKQKEEREREESILKKQSVEQEHLSEASLEQEPVDINRPMLDYIRTLVKYHVFGQESTYQIVGNDEN